MRGKKFFLGFISGVGAIIVLEIIVVLAILPELTITSDSSNNIDTEEELPSSFIHIKPITSDQLKLELEKMKGKPVIVNFWASWCSPCLKEIPVLLNFKEIYAADSLQLILVTVDPKRKNQIKIAERMLAKKGVDFQTYILDKTPSVNPVSTTNIEEFCTELEFSGFKSVPYSVYIDKTGEITGFLNGFPKDDKYIDEVKKEMNELIRKSLLSDKR